MMCLIDMFEYIIYNNVIYTVAILLYNYCPFNIVIHVLIFNPLSVSL